MQNGVTCPWVEELVGMNNKTGFELPFREGAKRKASYYVHSGGTGGWWFVLQYLAVEVIGAPQQASGGTHLGGHGLDNLTGRRPGY